MSNFNGSYLTDSIIEWELKAGSLKIESKNEDIPFDPDLQIQPASVDLKLGENFAINKPNKDGFITLDEKMKVEQITGKEVIIEPNSFLLATTAEYIYVPIHMIGRIEGRSSIGRTGLFIENAGWVDPGFYGQITLELYNANKYPIKIKSGRRICQLVLAYTYEPVGTPYNGKYNGQTGPTESRVSEDEEVS